MSQTHSELGKPFLTAWLPKDYGAEPQNWAIVQDDRGVMYFGNNSGILEYDGVSWRLIQFPNKTVCRSLAKDTNGRIYAGGKGDFGYLAQDPEVSGGQMRFVSLLPQLPKDMRNFADVWVTLVLRESIYFLTNNRLFRWTPSGSSSGSHPAGKIKLWQSDNGFHGSFVVDDAFYIREWVIGLLRMQGDSLQLVPSGEQFANERIYVMLPFPEGGITAEGEEIPPNPPLIKRGTRGDSLFKEGTGKSSFEKGGFRGILVGTRTQGLFLYDDQTFHPFKTEADAFLQQNPLYLPGAVLNDGRLLLNTTSGGAVLLDRSGKLLKTIDRTSGLPDNTVHYVYSDPARPEVQWLALGNGITRVEAAGPFSTFDADRGLESTVLKVQRHHGVLYAATNVGIFFLDATSGTFKPVKIPVVQSWDFLVIDGQLLAATSDGVYSIDGDQGTFVRRSVNKDFRSSVFHRSRQDSQRVFVGLFDGLACLRRENGVWRNEGRAPSIQDEIRTLVETKYGKLWAGTNATGILRLTFPSNGPNIWQDLQVERFGSKQGLPDGGVFIYEINGAPYFITPDDIYRFDATSQRFMADSTFNVVSSHGNLASRFLKEDQQGRVWVGLGREPALGTRQADGSYRWLKTPFRRFSDEVISTIYSEDNGVVWFGGASGLIRYDLNVEVNYAVDYPALVRRVVVGKDSVIFGGTVEMFRRNVSTEREAPTLAYSHNNLRFAYSASAYEDASRLQFQTWLEGFDKEWSNWNDKTEKEYTNLPENDYHFRVRAKNIYEHVSQEGVYSFTILPPWYRTWWAYVFYVLVLAAGIFAVDRFQRKRLLARERERAEIERKTEELEEARKLQLSMLPKDVPQIPHLDIAVYMQTASEVGGDYYDFSIKEDGSINICVGDATGHGMKAGTIVTMMKSLFIANSSEKNIEEFFASTNAAIKNSNLARMMAGFAMLNISDNKAKYLNAGMPSIYHFKKNKGKVEEIKQYNLPLGAMKTGKYNSTELFLDKSDVILMMSDGFPELYNSLDELFGYERVYSSFEKVTEKEPNEIIKHLIEESLRWSQGKELHDDVTFVVIKMK